MIPFKTKKSTIPVITLSGLLAASSMGAWAGGGQFTGTVVGVTDGDTITVLDRLKKQHTVRLAYIDAPETSCHAKHPSSRDDACVEKSQPFGKASKKHLSKLIYQAEVRVSVISGSTYGRELGVVYTMKNGREINANHEQIRAGYAWFYKHYAKKQMTHGEYTAWNEAETLARGAHIGLWSDPNPVSPWDYRRGVEGGGVSLQGKMGEAAKAATTAVMQNAGEMAAAGADVFNRVRARMRF